MGQPWWPWWQRLVISEIVDVVSMVAMNTATSDNDDQATTTVPRNLDVPPTLLEIPCASFSLPMHVGALQ